MNMDMNMNQINIVNRYQSQADVVEKSTAKKETASTKKAASDDSAAVYDRTSIVAQLKSDNEARINQMKEMVRSAISTQWGLSANDDDVWSFLAKGNFTVSAEVKATAQEAISEDGYWGVEKTSDRILEFAKALSGDDVSKAEMLLDAFKKGYQQATGAWGKDLPSICGETYKAVEEKFNNWMKDAEASV